MIRPAVRAGLVVLAGIALGAGLSPVVQPMLARPAARTCPTPTFRREDPAWRRGAPAVAHALGSADGRSVTNSREAFDGSYARGFRAFEVDLAFTSDDSLVATHDWTDGWRRLAPLRPSWSRFMRTPVQSRFTALDARALLSMLRAHADAWLVVDAKDDVGATLRRLVVTARATGDTSVLRRIVPQLYHACDLEHARAAYAWPATIHTLYRSTDGDADVLRFVRASGVSTVTMNESRFSPSLVRALSASGVAVYVHTINDGGTIARLRRDGATGIYTDLRHPP